jgi:hypothetical protein
VPQSAEVISHWHQSVDGLSISTLEFYASLEIALRDKEVADLRIERIMFNEHGILSAKREYLGVSYGRFRFDICAAPFGKDFFFSWWLAKRTPGFAALWGCATIIAVPLLVLAFIGTFGFFKGIFFAIAALVGGALVLKASLAEGWGAVEDAILAIPTLGIIYRKFFMPVTYYSEDTRIMFEETVHRILVQVIEGVLTLNKLPPIPTERLKPQSRTPIV